MKDKDRAAQLIAELKALAENDFERHRIDVLERDLTSPPVAIQIDERHQLFDGITYTKDKSGHYRRSSWVHTAIWCYYHGGIPQDGERYVVHHDDWNPENNTPSNLVLVTGSEHGKIHNTTQIPIPMSSFVCDNCGKTFESPINSKGKKVHFCSLKCQKAATYKRQPAIEHVCEYCGIRICQICGEEFEAVQGNHKYCSTKCAQKAKRALKAARRRKRKIREPQEKICPVCNKVFVPENPRQMYCSEKCSNTANWRRRKERERQKSPQLELPFDEI